MRPFLLLTVVLLSTLTGCARPRANISGAESDRIIRANELAALEVCRSFVRAQLDYVLADRDGDGVREYARAFVRTRKQPDGLAANSLWERIAEAHDGGTPYRGYHYRLLTRQGASAAGGVRDYLVGAHLAGGFALVSWPASYGISGRSTFLVNQSGRVLRKDLGPQTATIARAMTSYNPNPNWTAEPSVP